MTKKDKKLVDAVLDQIIKDIEIGDLTAIEEMLVQVIKYSRYLQSEEILKSYLDEETLLCL
tara:strand:+ start:8546 stop:8728 length:183 start_codon:yes stop_codon:yes gene_type:complete